MSKVEVVHSLARAVQAVVFTLKIGLDFFKKIKTAALMRECNFANSANSTGQDSILHHFASKLDLVRI